LSELNRRKKWDVSEQARGKGHNSEVIIKEKKLKKKKKTKSKKNKDVGPHVRSGAVQSGSGERTEAQLYGGVETMRKKGKGRRGE